MFQPSAPARGLRRVAAKFVFAAAIAALLVGCSKESPGAKPAEAKRGGKSAEKVPVLVAKVVRKAVPLRLEVIGNVEPLTTVSIKSRVEGQLDRAAFREGDAVSAGQLLFEIDPRPFRAQLRQAQANLTRDQAQLDNAKATLRRYEDLQGKNFVSADVLQAARTAAQVGAANIQADEAAVEAARLQLDYATIHSPLAGRSGRLMVHPGNQVKADSVLVVINQIQPVRVSFAVPEQYLAALREAAHAAKVSAKIDGSTAPPPVGQLSFIDNAVDAATGTIKLKATFDNPDERLWPGQFVRVALDLKQEAGAKVIPAKAAQVGPKGSYVFVIKPDMTAEQREISVARVQDEEAVIASGLEEGEQVVLDGQSRLVNGSAVDIKPGSAR